MKENHDKYWQNTCALLKVSFNVFGLLKECEILRSLRIQEILQKQRTDINIWAHIFFSPSQLDTSFYWIHTSIEHLPLAFCLDAVFGGFTRESHFVLFTVTSSALKSELHYIGSSEKLLLRETKVRWYWQVFLLLFPQGPCSPVHPLMAIFNVRWFWTTWHLLWSLPSFLQFQMLSHHTFVLLSFR